MPDLDFLDIGSHAWSLSQKASTTSWLLCEPKIVRLTSAPRKYLPTHFELSQSLLRDAFIARNKEVDA
eukprot:7936124-Heterocapsa_arctica.AAC.1